MNSGSFSIIRRKDETTKVKIQEEDNCQENEISSSFNVISNSAFNNFEDWSKQQAYNYFYKFPELHPHLQMIVDNFQVFDDLKSIQDNIDELILNDQKARKCLLEQIQQIHIETNRLAPILTITVQDKTKSTQTIQYNNVTDFCIVCTIGRNSVNDVVVQRPSVSNFHLQIYMKDKQLYLVDESSTFGTFRVMNKGDSNTIFGNQEKIIIEKYQLMIEIFDCQECIDPIQVKAINQEDFKLTMKKGKLEVNTANDQIGSDNELLEGGTQSFCLGILSFVSENNCYKYTHTNRKINTLIGLTPIISYQLNFKESNVYILGKQAQIRLKQYYI